MRVSDLLCMSNLVHASATKEHDNDDDYQGAFDELLIGVDNANDLLGDKGLMKEIKVRFMERMLGAELTKHLGYEPLGEPTSEQTNRRNGATRKVLKGNDGAVPIDIPRDRPSHQNCVSTAGQWMVASIRS